SALTHVDRRAEDGERRGRFLEAVLVASGGLASRLAIERGRLAEVPGGGVRVERLRGTQLAYRFAELLVEHRGRRTERPAASATRKHQKQHGRRQDGGNSQRLEFGHHG